MRTIVHLSDLHFGRIDPQLIAPLTGLIGATAPDVLVVSGDLTQRARSAEFLAAKKFLDALPGPQIIVPGNHDIPLHNIFDRFVRPLDKYRRYITDDLAPQFIDTEIAIFGINTARSLTIKNGRVGVADMRAVHARLAALDPLLTKIIVTHHPFDLPDDFDEKNLVGRASGAMALFATCGADVLLAGHLHATHAGSSQERYPHSDYAALVVQAGTATSTRGRGESNSFNILRIDAGRVDVDHLSWQPDDNRFAVVDTDRFERSGRGWQKVV